MERLSILVVDDVADFTEVLAAQLRGLGHGVTCAANGHEAAALLNDSPFDLVVTDIIMPVSDGFELIDAVKRAQPNARILAMSGGGKFYSAQACLQAVEHSGVDAVLLKPFNPQQLVETVERIFTPQKSTDS